MSGPDLPFDLGKLTGMGRPKSTALILDDPWPVKVSSFAAQIASLHPDIELVIDGGEGVGELPIRWAGRREDGRFGICVAVPGPDEAAYRRTLGIDPPKEPGPGASKAWLKTSDMDAIEDLEACVELRRSGFNRLNIGGAIELTVWPPYKSEPVRYTSTAKGEWTQTHPAPDAWTPRRCDMPSPRRREEFVETPDGLVRDAPVRAPIAFVHIDEHERAVQAKHELDEALSKWHDLACDIGDVDGDQHGDAGLRLAVIAAFEEMARDASKALRLERERDGYRVWAKGHVGMDLPGDSDGELRRMLSARLRDGVAMGEALGQWRAWATTRGGNPTGSGASMRDVLDESRAELREDAAFRLRNVQTAVASGCAAVRTEADRESRRLKGLLDTCEELLDAWRARAVGLLGYGTFARWGGDDAGLWKRLLHALARDSTTPVRGLLALAVDGKPAHSLERLFDRLDDVLAEAREAIEHGDKVNAAGVEEGRRLEREGREEADDRAHLAAAREGCTARLNGKKRGDHVYMGDAHARSHAEGWEAADSGVEHRLKGKADDGHYIAQHTSEAFDRGYINTDDRLRNGSMPRTACLWSDLATWTDPAGVPTSAFGGWREAWQACALWYLSLHHDRPVQVW